MVPPKKMPRRGKNRAIKNARDKRFRDLLDEVFKRHHDTLLALSQE